MDDAIKVAAKRGGHRLGCELECGPGWYGLIERLCTAWTGLGRAMVIDAVREKYGKLAISARVVAGVFTWEDERLVRHVEFLSERRCEHCGCLGHLYARHGFLITRCALHAGDCARRDDGLGRDHVAQDCDRIISWITEWRNKYRIEDLLPTSLLNDPNITYCLSVPDDDMRLQRLQSLLAPGSPYRPINLPFPVDLSSAHRHAI